MFLCYELEEKLEIVLIIDVKREREMVEWGENIN